MIDNKIPGYNKIWKISFPIILSLMAQNAINVTDTAFLGRVGEVYKLPAHIVWLSEFVYFIIMGIMSYWYLKTGHWKKIKI